MVVVAVLGCGSVIFFCCCEGGIFLSFLMMFGMRIVTNGLE